MSNILNTSGMKNVEDAFAKGGGSGTRTAGAATDKGTTTSTSKETPSTTGMGTQSHQEKFGDQYKPPGFFGKMFSKAVSGSKTSSNGVNSGTG